MRVSADQAKVTARAFAIARQKAWDDTGARVAERNIEGKVYWAVTTTDTDLSPVAWDTPLDIPTVDYLIDRESGRCVGIANYRMIHWLPKSRETGDGA